MNQPGLRFHLPLPPATKALFLANVAVFVVNMLLLGRLGDRMPDGGGAWLAFSWPGLLDGYGLGLLRVVTYQFTHAFTDVWHVLSNMIALWVFGPMVEQRLRRDGTVRLYLWGGAVGALGHVVVSAVQGSMATPLVGASGACYALLVHAACRNPHATIVFLVVQMPLWFLATLLCGIGAYQTFVELATGAHGGVAHSAHLGGALLGFVAFRAGWFTAHDDAWRPERAGRAWPWQRWLAALRSRRLARAQQAAAAQEMQLDTILAKVKAEGLGALRADERRFLERISGQSRG